jgi:hypothetical protein
MDRQNVQMAFVGEGTTADDIAPENLVTGDEAVNVAVKGGKLMIVVPAGTPDQAIFDDASMLGGELLLENGVTLSFEIKDGATGAQFMATRDGEREDTHTGLSALKDVPGGA